MPCLIHVFLSNEVGLDQRTVRSKEQDFNAKSDVAAVPRRASRPRMLRCIVDDGPLVRVLYDTACPACHWWQTRLYASKDGDKCMHLQVLRSRNELPKQDRSQAHLRTRHSGQTFEASCGREDEIPVGTRTPSWMLIPHHCVKQATTSPSYKREADGKTGSVEVSLLGFVESGAFTRCVFVSLLFLGTELTKRHDLFCEPKLTLDFLEVIEQHTSCKAQVLKMRLMEWIGHLCWKRFSLKLVAMRLAAICVG